jgi:hypothetical protein
MLGRRPLYFPVAMTSHSHGATPARIVSPQANIELAVVNMSVNARDAMGQGCGTIALTAENTSLVRGDIDDDLEGDRAIAGTLRGCLETPARVLNLGKSVESKRSPIAGAFDVDCRDPGRA